MLSVVIISPLYNAYSTGDPSPLAPLPIEYADFPIWQRHWLTGDLLQTQLAYWQKQLFGAPALSQSELLQDSAWGWSAFSSVPVDVQFVSGNHVTMMTQPHVQVLAERLNACIHEAMQKIGLPETLN